MKSTDVPATFRDMWETRPARPRDDRMVAGVAAGIARRYDIDPVLVRVGFVVAALSGIGAVLYIAGWIVLPDTPAAPDAPRRRRPNVMLMVAIGIAIAIGFGGLFGDGGGFLLPALAVAALLFLLHTYRGDRPTVPPPADPAAEPATGVSLTKDLPGTPPQPTPPSWDPLGAAPFAWDLPEPAPVEPPAPAPRRAPVTAVTLGAALLAGGATAAIMLLTGALSFATVPTVLGVGLAVLGAGLVVGSFLRTGRGIIPFAVILALLAWAVMSVPWDRIPAGGVGDLTVRPSAAADVAPSYARAAGDIVLDLRLVDLSGPPAAPVPPAPPVPAPPGSPVRTQLSTGAGTITVIVPANADVTFTGSAEFGSVSFAGRQDDGGPGARMSLTDLGADGVASGRPIVIGAHAGAGDVEVRRA